MPRILGLIAGVISAVTPILPRRQDHSPLVVLIAYRSRPSWLGPPADSGLRGNLALVSRVRHVCDLWRRLDRLISIHHLFLPALTLASVATGVIARLTRTADARGSAPRGIISAPRAPRAVSENRVIYRQCLQGRPGDRHSGIGIQAGFVLGGAVYIVDCFPVAGESARCWSRRSDAVICCSSRAGVLVVAAAFVLFNLAADVLQTVLGSDGCADGGGRHGNRHWGGRRAAEKSRPDAPDKPQGCCSTTSWRRQVWSSSALIVLNRTRRPPGCPCLAPMRPRRPNRLLTAR